MSEAESKSPQVGSASADPPNRAVKTIVETLFGDGILRDAKDRIDTRPITLWGEVLHVRDLGHKLVLTLLDSKRDDVFIEATLPSGGDPPPEVGDSIGIVGTPDVRSIGSASLQLVFRGTSWKLSYRDQTRFRQWRDCFEELKATVVPCELTEPAETIALVTGRSSKARRDFESRLFYREKDRTSVAVQIVEVKLDDAQDIARGILEAATIPEVDLIVLARGGGSPVDLNRFNHPDVLKAVTEIVQRVPVLAALGHTEDSTWTDQLATYQQPVPAAAGDWVRQQNFRMRERSARPVAPSPVGVAPGAPLLPAPSAPVVREVVVVRQPSPTAAPSIRRLPQAVPPRRGRLKRLAFRLVLAAVLIGLGWLGRDFYRPPPTRPTSPVSPEVNAASAVRSTAEPPAAAKPSPRKKRSRADRMPPIGVPAQ